DSFFALGGHSLLATQLVARIRQAFGVEVALREVFDAPTISGLAAGIDARAVLEPAPAIVRVPRKGDLPLSFAQQRLWLLDQLEPGSAAYNVPLAVRLTGELRVERLEAVFAELVRRHEPLRTTFAERSGQPVQVIADEMRLALPVADLSALPECEPLAYRLAREEARLPFDLRRGPLLRLFLLRLGERDHILLMTLHHIVSDGWSLGVLLREVAALHAGVPLPELPVQYADFAVWQRRWLQGRVLEAQLAYWKRQLAGAPRVLELPADRPRPAVQTYRGASRGLVLPPHLSTTVYGLCRCEGATPFMVLLAAWAALLGRHAGQEDVLVGTPIAGRNRQEIEGLIGFFINTLVLRVDLSEALDFSTLLGRVRQTALEAYDHQDLPFERLVEDLVPERDLAHSPLFQVLFGLQNAAGRNLSLPGLTLTPLARDNGMAKFDLTLSLQEGPAGFEGAFTYNTDLFDGSTAARLLDRFQILLAAVEDLSLPLAELPWLTVAERHQALLEWNDTARLYVPGVCLHELVARQAGRTPDAVAVVFAGRELSYGELERRANRLAHHLIALGIEPEDRVGLRLERSLEMVVGVLGVLKAGAAYVPLDPTYPAERLALLVAGSGARVVLMPESWEEMGERPDGPPPVRSGADNLAYVLFTSGSTGAPKGVMVPHRGVVNRLLWAQEVYRLGPGDAVLQKAAFSFDFSVWEMFAPLLAGARLVLAEPGGHRDAAYLARTIAEHEVSIVHFVPSMLGVFLEEPGIDLCASLRQVFAGGEALSPALRDRFLERLGRIPLDNQYGPTEISIDTMRWVCRPGPVSLGRPIANARLYVVDRGLRPQPPGVAGELLIGGAGPARGYLGRPDLTAVAFVPDPFGGGAGGRLYRTGDLVRHRPDGGLEFLGRIDHQVKVRGFRIELGEVEAVLASHPAVRECVVMAREDAPRVHLLVAYVTGDAEVGELRSFAAGRLPEYMVPAVFVPMEALPLSPNGKVDRRSLPTPERVQTAVVEEHEAPADLLEELLAGIWSEVLGLAAAGRHDDFFALGGHSLLATQVISRVRKVLGIELPLRALFESPTVSGLARTVRTLRRKQALEAPPIVPVPRDGRDLPLSFSQQRLWFLDQLEPGNPAYNVPLAVRLTGELRVDLLQRAFTEVVRRHEALRTTFNSYDGRPVQVVSPEPGVELPVVDLSQLPEREARALELARAAARRPFDLRRGPLLRLALLRLGPCEHVLLLILHHIVSDGWSMGVLLREVAALYSLQGLPELPVQYADFAVWQRRWLQGEALEAQLGYWRRQLARAPRVLELPLDRPRPAVQTFRGGSRRVALSPSLSEAMYGLCRRAGTTPFMAFLAAWGAVLGRHAGLEDVLLGTPIAGRNRQEIEGLVGFFVNTLVLRIDLSGSPDFAGLLQQVRRTALDGYACQDVPFERLVEEMVPERDMARSPLFQVMLMLQNASGGGLSIPGLALAPLSLEGGAAKFDLTLAMEERRDRVFEGALQYNSDLFDGSTAVRILDRFQVLLAAAVADPECPVPELPLLTGVERFQLLSAWNDTAAEPLAEPWLHRRLLAAAARYPREVALIQGERRLTFEEVARRAERLAAGLSVQGVGPEIVVGLRLERSPELVIAALAVLMAGGAYLPLDPGLPEERQAALLADAGAALVLSPEFWPEAPAPDVLPEADPENLAYVLYTSGSTGRPKGVMVQHRALARYLDWALQAYEVAVGQGAPVHSSLGFDLTVTGLWAPLLAGRPVTLLPEEHGVEALATTVRPGADFSLVKLTPAHLDLLAQQVAPESVAGWARALVVGGETLRGESLAFWREHAPQTRIFNEYGPTETVVGCSVQEVIPSAAGPLPIGRPIAGARLYVLDRSLHLAPLGSVGELWIGGEGVTRGYRRDPAQTAERFFPDPFSAAPGARLYRSGDVTRQRADGTLELLGRTDHQVKVRGFRIELGEIEAALLRHPQVRECAAMVRDGALLVAYVVGTAERDALRAFLGERLPGYMVPSAFAVLESLPLTANGKVDRAALSASAAPERTRQAVEPRDLLELRLVRLWEELLQVQPVGVRDDFFELGGHSLLAIQLVSRVRKSFAKRLPLAAVLRNPTVERLAMVLREGEEPSRGVLVELAAGTGRPFFCVHAVGGEVLSYVHLARHLDRPVYGFQAQEDATLEEMAARYIRALREVQPEGPYSLGGWSMGGVVAFEMARQLEQQDEAVDAVVLIDSRAPRQVPERADGELVALFAQDVSRLLGLGGLDLPPQLDAGEALHWLSAEAERTGLLPPGAGSGEVERRFAAFQANFRALERYSGEPCAAPLILFQASRPDPDLGWGCLARGPFETHQLAGDHYTLLRPPHVEGLARLLRQRLADAAGRP
ncbi:MAG TPA: amino acid adenylation domain-containing protein, partial [Thermoanaerobaculia bacterium]|nr:amino acid adenylation domain-containing protein [Thermoanaerobaculia bacterium]